MFKEYLSYCCNCRKNSKCTLTLDCKHPLCINCIASLLVNNQSSQMLTDQIQVQCKDCSYATFLSIPLAYKLTRSLNLRNFTSQSQNNKLALFCMECLERPFTIEQYLSGMHKNHKIKTIDQATPFLLNILTYAARDLEQSVDNLYRQQQKLQHCIHLMNDVVAANITRIKLGFEQLRSQMNKRQEQIILAYRIAVQKQFRTVQIDLEQLHTIIEKGKSQLQWIVEKVTENEQKKWNHDQKINLTNYFAENSPSFSAPRLFEQNIKEKVPSYMQIVRLNREIVSINEIKPIVDSIRVLRCFQEQEMDQTSTEASSTLSSSYFEQKKKQIFGQHMNTYPFYPSKLHMLDKKQTQKRLKNKKQVTNQNKKLFFNRRLQ